MFSKAKFLLLVAISGAAAFACPSKEAVLKTLKEMQIPVTEVKKIESSKEIKEFCTAVGILEKYGTKREVVFFVTKDGKFLVPFVGSVSYKPSPVEGLKEVWITSVRFPDHKFKLGYVTEDGKYYIPELVPMKKVQLKEETKKVNGNGTSPKSAQ